MKHPVLGLQVVPFCPFTVGSPVPIPSSRKKWVPLLLRRYRRSLFLTGIIQNPQITGTFFFDFFDLVVRVVMGILVETTTSTGF